MKTVTAIFAIFCAYVRVADNIEIKPVKILGGALENIGAAVSDVAHKVVPECIFGVESVSMVLYTRDIPFGRNIGVDEVCGDFDRSQPIIFLVHGFISNANYTNSYKLSKALIEKGFTVFSLDWSDAACTTGLPIVNFAGFPRAVQNTREIGQLMANYVVSLIEKCGVPLTNMIFVGHSLGAHVCGFASKEIRKSGYGLVPLLFAADPARPIFLLNKCEDRFCKTDADTTVVLHTSSFSMTRPIGDVDLYFNGGIRQPGCSVNIACAHSSAVYYLAEIVEHDCSFPGIPMSYSAIAALIGSEPSYPDPHITDCLIMDSAIFNANRGFNELKGKSYYMFVDWDTLCTKKSFSCQH